MSSTHFNVGLNDGRNSSRVLKPPGGGHTDIFGSYEERAPKPKQRQASQITDCFIMDDNKGKKTIQEPPVVNKPEEDTENAAPVDNEASPDQNPPSPQNNGQPAQNVPLIPNKEQTDKPIIATPQKVRVPPGGYSSGFW